VTIYLVVGLPGAGKTTRARELEADLPALRLTPDEWQMSIFSDDGPHRWRSEERAAHRDRIEGKLIDVGMRAGQLGIDVVLDFGLWSRDERSALRWIAHSLGVPVQVIYLPIDYEEQRRRVTGRSRSEPRQFQMTDAELEQWHTQLQEPDQEELCGGPIPPVPAGCTTWWQWACQHWPSLSEY